jgi:serine/threonine-protein kinase
MIRLKTDPDGKLIQFEAVPAQVEPPARSAAAFDWSRLFQAAGLNPAGFQPAEPEWTPLANWDSRAAWRGVDPATHVPLRVEAAAWRERPVFFRIIGPWTKPERATPSTISSNQIPVLILVYIALIAGCTLGWINFRAGRVDLRGANRLLLIYFLSQAAVHLVAMHHAAVQAELSLFWMSVSSAALNGLIVWIFYAALEPWVRRYWPQTIISWTRYVSKGLRDPLVGRDLLYGAALGMALALTNTAGVLLHGNNDQPLFPSLNPLQGMRLETAQILGIPSGAIFNSLLFFLLLFLLRLVLRKEWIAVLVFVIVVAVATTVGTITPAVDYALAAVSIAIVGLGLLRLGLLAAIVLSMVAQFASLGGALDFSTWYAGPASVPYLLILAIAVYGFKTSLGGRQLFKLDA